MFTGIVEELGHVASREGSRIVVRSPIGASDTAIGDSVAIDGVCLTVVGLDDDELSFDISQETFDRTSLEAPPVGRRRERRAAGHPRLTSRWASRAGARRRARRGDGRPPEGADGTRLSVRLPASLLRHVVEKGSITLDGVSLTVAALDGDVIDVALIPHTLHVTTLGAAGVGDRLNVEVDVIAKYVARNLEYLTTDGAAVVRHGKERTA